MLSREGMCMLFSSHLAMREVSLLADEEEKINGLS